MSIVHSITHIILFLMSCLVWCGFSSLTTQFWTLYNIILYGLFPTSTSTHEGSVHTLPFPPQSYTPWHSSCLYSINSPIAYFVIHQQRHSGSLFGVLLFFLAPGITSRSLCSNSRIPWVEDLLSHCSLVSLMCVSWLMLYHILLFFSRFNENYSHLKPLKVGQVKCPVFVLY